jgi:hypothetical protein
VLWKKIEVYVNELSVRGSLIRDEESIYTHSASGWHL